MVCRSRLKSKNGVLEPPRGSPLRFYFPSPLNSGREPLFELKEPARTRNAR